MPTPLPINNFFPLMHKFIPLLILLFTTLACSDSSNDNITPEETPEETPETPAATARRTVLMYCAAQNSLGYGTTYYKSNWTKDSLELAAGKHFISNDDRLLVFVDDAAHPRLYRFRADAAPELVFQWSYDANSANPSTLLDVLTRIKERFPAKEYGLCMWSHADGWIPSSNTNYAVAAPLSFGIDVGEQGNMSTDVSGDGISLGAQMNIPDMAKAVQQSGLHFTYIFFDACLMQCIEVAYDLRNATDYLIASPISIASNGAYYTHLLEHGLFSPHPEDIAKTYYEDITSKELSHEYDDFGIVISAIKTSELEALAQTIRTALEHVDLTTYPDLTAAHAYNVYAYTYFYRPHFYDMRSALRQLLTDEQFAPVEEAINRATPFYAATHKYWVGPRYNDFHNITSECCGISMFFPQEVYANNASRCPYGNHNETYRSTAWAQTIWKENKH